MAKPKPITDNPEPATELNAPSGSFINKVVSDYWPSPDTSEISVPLADPLATAPLKLLGSMTWEQERAYYQAHRKQLLGETNSGNTGNKN